MDIGDLVVMPGAPGYPGQRAVVHGRTDDWIILLTDLDHRWSPSPPEHTLRSWPVRLEGVLQVVPGEVEREVEVRVKMRLQLSVEDVLESELDEFLSEPANFDHIARGLTGFFDGYDFELEMGQIADNYVYATYASHVSVSRNITVVRPS